MFQRWAPGRWGTAGKALVALIGATGCLVAAAYAATSPLGPLSSRGSAAVSASISRKPRASRPRITRAPIKSSPSTVAEFRFRDRLRSARLQCLLDRSGWRPCSKRILYSGLSVGPHSFSVRATAPDMRPSLAAGFAWGQVTPKDFSIAAQPLSLAPLLPGAPAQPLRVVLGNPNSEPIFVTSLQVSVSSDPPGCPSADNLSLIASSASAATPVKIPANGSVTLPTQGVSAPTIAMVDSPVDQDACQDSQFPLRFSGEARG